MEETKLKRSGKSEVKQESDIAIKIDGVWEKFRLYHDKGSTLKETLVRLRRGRKYEGFWALKDVSLDIKKGEVFGLVGENGSGKTTLLKCVSRILVPSKGSIRVNGRVSALLEVGAGFHPELTGRENVYLNGTILGLSRREIDRRFDEIVHFAELEQFIDMPVRNYSAGMYVRLGFAVAVNVDPDILLVDEVIAVGDQAFQEKCKEKIDNIRESGKTILLVSHGLDNIQRLCDRAAWLEKGEVKAIGAAEKVIDLYLDRVRQKQERELREINKASKNVALSAGPRDVHQTNGSRWGSMEAVIKDVRFLGPDRGEKFVFKTGQPMTISIDYEAYERIESPSFGVAFYRADGVLCSCSATRFERPIDYIDGRGTIEYHIQDLLLLAGSYSITVNLYDKNGLHPYDHHEKLYHIKIIPGENHIPWGVCYQPASWELKRT